MSQQVLCALKRITSRLSVRLSTMHNAQQFTSIHINSQQFTSINKNRSASHHWQWHPLHQSLSSQSTHASPTVTEY